MLFYYLGAVFQREANIRDPSTIFILNPCYNFSGSRMRCKSSLKPCVPSPHAVLGFPPKGTRPPSIVIFLTLNPKTLKS